VFDGQPGGGADGSRDAVRVGGGIGIRIGIRIGIEFPGENGDGVPPPVGVRHRSDVIADRGCGTRLGGDRHVPAEPGRDLTASVAVLSLMVSISTARSRSEISAGCANRHDP
jgi:hypothetical protein